MINASKILGIEKFDSGEEGYCHWCPGCGGLHYIRTKQANPNQPCWTFDGNVEAPTFNPSVRVTWEFGPEKIKKECHYWVKAGSLHFDSSSTHDLKNKVVLIPTLEEGLNSP